MILNQVLYILVLIVSIFTFRRLNAPFRAIAVLHSITSVVELFAKVAIMYSLNYLWAYHLLMPILLGCYFYFYQCCLKEFGFWRIFRWMYLIAFVLLIWNSLSYQHVGLVPSINYNIVGFVVIGSSLITYLKMMENVENIPLKKDLIFLLNTSNLLYYSASYFVFTTSQFRILKDVRSLIPIKINMFLCLFFYSLIIYLLMMCYFKIRDERAK